MKCTNCQGEWTAPANKSLSKCPFCQADMLQMLNEKAEVLSTDVILGNMLQAYGTVLLQNQQRLAAMISDLFAHDHKTKRLLLLSVRENIPTQLAALSTTDKNERYTHILDMQHRLADEAFLKEEIVQQMVKNWTTALGWEHEDADEPFEKDLHEGLNGFKNANGEMITQSKYNDAWPFSEGLSRVKLNGKFGYINQQGNETIPLIYTNASDFSEGIAIVGRNGKFGYLDIQGKEMIPLKYDMASDFKEGLARVRLNGKYGFFDKKGKLGIILKYEYAEDFNKGLSLVVFNGKRGYIDKRGNWVKDANDE
ncbi:MAG: KWG Leptospira repeat protein [Bacteroidetes bacterium]|nr:MAG: KWG Leptospira repeat protein [Bacteroidota bacterium]